MVMSSMDLKDAFRQVHVELARAHLYPGMRLRSHCVYSTSRVIALGFGACLRRHPYTHSTPSFQVP